MFVVGFPAAAFGTNCYVLAPGPGQECLVVDPGVGVEAQLAEVLREHGLRPAAVLLTHGHLDHVYAVTPVCAGTLAAHIHSEDRYRLVDPLQSLDPGLVGMFEQQFGTRATWQEPERVEEMTGGQHLQLAGLELQVLHAPGHTEGSVMFTVADVPEGVAGRAEVSSSVFSGDVLFAGSIGRTDLPGGDAEVMRSSLREVVLPLPDTSLILPGHGPATTMAQERGSNPFLQDLV